MTRVYYKDAVGAAIVYDVTRAETFGMVEKWKADLDSKVLAQDGQPIPCVLIGNKSDQKSLNEIEAEASYMRDYCRDRGFAGWFATSAKVGHNVETACQFLVEKVLADARRLVLDNNLAAHRPSSVTGGSGRIRLLQAKQGPDVDSTDSAAATAAAARQTVNLVYGCSSSTKGSRSSCCN